MIPQTPQQPYYYPPPTGVEDARLAEDIATIQAYGNRAAVAAIADALRGVHSPAIPDNDDDLIPPFRSETTHYRRVTTRPIEAAPQPSTWWRRHGLHVAIAGGVVLVGTAAVLLVITVLNALGRAASSASYAVSSALPTLGGICLLVLLVLWLLGRGGGGKAFSGTFNGKLH